MFSAFLSFFKTTEEIKAVSTEEIKAVSTEEIKEVSTEEIKEVSTEEIKAVSTEEIKEVSTEEIKEVSTEEIKAVSTEEIKEVSTEEIKEVSTEEIKAVSTEEIKAVSTEEIKAVSTEDKKSTNHLLELFNKLHRGILYEELDILLKNAYSDSSIYTLKIIAHLRDDVFGRGERDLSKKAYRWLECNCEQQLIKNMELFIHKYGRWDDFIYLPLESNASNHYLALMSKQLTVDLENMKNGQAVSKVAKWIPSEKSNGYNHTGFNTELAKIMGLTNTALRKAYLTPLRKYISGIEKNEHVKPNFELKTHYSIDEMMDILSNSNYDDICYVEKF